MNLSNIQTPGVYINEINAFPNSVVPVATAVPAFVGYTPQAAFNGKSYLNLAQKITSFNDFQAIYCLPNVSGQVNPSKQYAPQYYLVQQKSQPAGPYMLINNIYYAIVPDPNTIYYLYNSVRLFYENGGGDAYIVSVGGYGAPSGNATAPNAQIINPNVKLNDLTNGLALLKGQQDPTMYICPEATLLSIADNGTLMQEMLLQCQEMQTAMAIFDVIGGRNPDPLAYTNDIATFRNNTGTNGLNYGAAYYPFVETTITQNGDIDYTNLFGSDATQLIPLINPADNPNPNAAAILNQITAAPGGSLNISQYNTALLNASQTYTQIINQIVSQVNVLPPSGGMAGVITVNDNLNGVWNAPANTSIVGVTDVPIRLSDDQQANLNVDAVTGKSVNAIRFFNGIGILVWGARTLDGNSNDWRYISVRRTVTMIEQSCKQVLQAYAFQPNTKNTWNAVTSMLSSFLTSIWKQGGLMGATASDAFSVSCGLGTTMTGDDILNGYMNASVQVAVTHPAEFIVITLQQQMQVS